MGTNKLVIFIVSVLFTNLNLFGTNNVFALRNIEIDTLKVQSTVSANEIKEKLLVKHKRSKRDDSDKASYILNGYVENGTVPVNFPKDICLFELHGILYAAVLHYSTHPDSSANQTTILTIFKSQENGEYAEIFIYETNSAVDMDCLSKEDVGFVAVSNKIEKEIKNLSEGSPIFQVSANSISIVQYFSMPFQNRVYLRKHGNHLYFMQSFLNKPNTLSLCPVFRWAINHFDLIDELPCSNAMQMEPFTIGSDIYIAIANNKDQFGESATYSLIYKFNIEHKRFLLHQSILTHAAVDVKYFKINHEHFLVFANSYEKVDGEVINHETQSIIFKLSNFYFNFFQTILLFDVTQFLPVLGPKNEFILLISCKRQPTKAWQYNGWMFSESDVQFTGGALGQGVSNMRTYLLKGTMAIVIANTYMMKEASNIFFPQFVLRKNVNVLPEAIKKWCDANKIDVSDIAETENLAFELEKMPKRKVQSKDKRSIPDAQFIDNIYFEDVSIDTITTESLKMKDFVLDRFLVDQLNSVNDIVQDLSKRIDVIEKRMLSEKRSTLTDNISTKPLEFEYDHNTLLPAAQMVDEDNEFLSSDFEDSVVDELTVENMIYAEFINGHAFKDLVFTERDLNVSEVVVDELNLNNYENYKEIMAKVTPVPNQTEIVADSLPPIDNIVVPNDGVIDKLVLNSLKVDGLINHLDIEILNEFALKLHGDQVFESEMSFELLQGTSLQTTSTISGRDINEIVQIASGTFAVDHIVQFSHPINVNELVVLQRINNIHVVDGHFDILLKRSDRHQVIQGMKTFDEVKLQSPIILQGKIRKSNLNQINPIVSITDDIVLEGDYEIRGNTTIERVLRAENIYGMGGVYNVKDLFIDGLPLGTPVISQIFEFVQPIKTTNLWSDSVNNVDVSKFVRTDEIQHVYGVKSFTGDLHVTNGVCDAFKINDVDLAVLNETVLKTTGDQVVEGKIHFKGMHTQRAVAKSISLFGHNYNNFLTKTDQIITGNIIVKGNLIVNNIQIENVRTNNKICGYDLKSIIDDTITTSIESRNSIVTGEKFFRNHLTLDTIQVKGNVFQLGTLETVLGYLRMLTENVILEGPFTFPNNLKVDKLIFTQSINGISSADFGTQWLLSETDQDFTSPQTVYTIKTVEDVVLNGTFNYFDLNNLFQSTQFKDEPIAFKNASFAQAVFQQPITLDGLLSGIKFPDDIVLMDADFPQSISGFVTFNDLNVSGSITVLGKINDIDYNIACDLVSPDASSYGLIIDHDAKFLYVPQVENLNRLNINKLYQDVWLTNRIAELTGIPIFSEVKFTKPIEIKGLLNGRNIGYVRDHYVSLTKPQQILSTIQINGNVLFQESVKAERMYMSGVIKDSLSGVAIKIEEFDQTVFKRNVDQVITEQWYIAKANVVGDLNTLINGVNFATDVVKYSNPLNNVTAVKSFQSMSVQNLNCQNGCKLMNVDVGDWISKVALVSGNYTIQGTVVIDGPIFYDNLNVLGLVNNLTFTPDNILLKSQRQNINGNVYISNKSVYDNRILPLSFENLQVELINGKPVTLFYLNVVYKDDPLTTINTRVEFRELLSVDYMQLHGEFNGINLNDLLNQVQSYQTVTNYSDHLDHFGAIGNGIVEQLERKRNYLETLRLTQVIIGNIKKIISIEVVTPTDRLDVFVLLNITDVNGFLNFYVFDRDTSILTLADSLFGFQPKDMYILDIFSVVVNNRDFVVVQTQNHFTGNLKHSFFTHFKGHFRNVYEMRGNISREIVGLNMGSDDCFITFSRHATNVAIACAVFNVPGLLGFQQVDELYSSSGILQVCSVTSENRVEIITLDIEGKICIWFLNQQHKFVRSQIIKTLHMTTHITIANYKNFHYIAACSQSIPSSVHLGSVEIYLSSALAYVNIQSIVIESPTRVELSVVSPTNDLVLYVLTDSIAKPLIVYRYTGLTKFSEFTTGATIPRAQRLHILKAKVRDTELISLISEGVGVMIIEVAVN